MEKLDFARPLPVSSMHIQTAPKGVPQRLPFGTGQLEVLRIDKVRKALHQPKADEPDGAFVRARMVLEGVPASSRSVVHQAILAFVDPGIDPPLSRTDHARGTLHVYYPISDFERIAALLRTGKRRLCYCWLSADSTRSVVMLMAMG
ncbi:MAG: hypothetical protein KA791_06185 [Flavobacteriales bacterium]|nr:hypothetical protein [Flavobacteriales bacterium]